jgi:hypothetical protein
MPTCTCEDIYYHNTTKLRSDINRDEPALFGKGKSADNYETGKSRNKQVHIWVNS